MSGTENPTGAPPSPPSGQPSNPPQQGFTQEDLNRIAAREKDEGRRSGQREILESLGVKSAEELQELVKGAKEAQDAKLSDADKAIKKAERDSDQAATATAEANLIKHAARVRDALLRELMGEEGAAVLDQASKLVRMVDVEGDADDRALEAAVADLKKTFPQMFSSPQSGGNGTPPVPRSQAAPPGSPPAPPRGSGSSGSSPADKARALLHERHPRSVKKE